MLPALLQSIVAHIITSACMLPATCSSTHYYFLCRHLHATCSSPVYSSTHYYYLCRHLHACYLLPAQAHIITSSAGIYMLPATCSSPVYSSTHYYYLCRHLHAARHTVQHAHVTHACTQRGCYIFSPSWINLVDRTRYVRWNLQLSQ